MSNGESHREEPMKTEAGEAVYLYCFARSALLPNVEGKSVDGRNPLLLRRYLDIAAVASMTTLDEFCVESAEFRMLDLTWVGPRACRHEEVVEHVMRRSPVLPARFGTIFSSPESLERVLKKHHGTVSRFLDWVVDKEEWAVKCLLNRAKAKEKLLSTTLAAHADRLASSPPGKRYFEEQRIGADVEIELNCWLKRVCEGIVNELSSHASDSRERRVLPTNDAGTEAALNWAFMVPQGAVPRFCARIDRANASYAEQGLVFERSGPWPPYSFCPSLEREPGK